MENTNRSDVERFFNDMPRNLQLEAICNLNRQKKPPDSIELLYHSQQREWEQFKADIAESDGGLKSLSYCVK